MKTLIEQFESAPRTQVVPLKLGELSRDEHFLSVHMYPWSLRPAKGEAGLLGRSHGRILHAVYERIICLANAVDPREVKEGRGSKESLYEDDDAKRYVAAPIPGQKFLDSRGQ